MNQNLVEVTILILTECFQQELLDNQIEIKISQLTVT